MFVIIAALRLGQQKASTTHTSVLTLQNVKSVDLMVLFNAFGIYIHTYVQTHIYELGL